MIMTRMRAVVLVICLAFLITGCETTSGQKGTIGGLGGAAAGGLLAAAAGGGATGIAAGTILGGLVGGAIGNRMDAADRREAQRAATQAFDTTPSGQSVAWRNPDSGNSGRITPTRTYQTASGQYCREFQQTVTIGGETQQAFGRACRQPNGSWQIVS
jgi:surface antigen